MLLFFMTVALVLALCFTILVSVIGLLAIAWLGVLFYQDRRVVLFN